MRLSKAAGNKVVPCRNGYHASRLARLAFLFTSWRLRLTKLATLLIKKKRKRRWRDLNPRDLLITSQTLLRVPDAMAGVWCIPLSYTATMYGDTYNNVYGIN